MRKEFLWLALPIGVLVTVGLLYISGILPPGRNLEWADSLRAEAAGADRLVIQDIWRRKDARPNYEIQGADVIGGMLDLIEIDAAGSGRSCDCLGQYLIQIYRSDKEVVTLSYHHGKSLRWRGGKWEGDGLLTSTAQEALPRWFKDNGYPALQDDRETDLAEEKRM